MSTEIEALTDLVRRRLINDRSSATALGGLQNQNDDLLRQLTGRSLIPFLRAVRRIVERVSEQIVAESGEDYSFAESILDELLDAVTLLDVEVIVQTGDLDPEVHNSVATSNADVPAPTVIEVLRPGFARAGAVLLPADVVVALPENEVV